jgi:hypothetical protein
LIKKLWETAWDLWEHRNGILHEKENIVTRAMGIQLDHRVARVYRQLYELPLNLRGRHLVTNTLAQILKKDSNFKEAWLAVAEPALRTKRKDRWNKRTQMRRTMKGMKQVMTAWLRR